MKKIILPLALVSAMIVSGCGKIQDQIDDLNGRLEVLEGSTIKSITEQISGINSSIEDLEGVDAALQTLIDGLTSKAADLQSQLDANAAADAEAKKALQAEIANINALIAALQAKDAELDQKIADLKAYVDGEIGSTEDWANATFATLEQYSAIQTEISTLKALIETYKTDITAAYTKAIEDAIAASEESMKEWVNELLAEGYYDIAQIDAMLAALETKLAGADSDLANQISAQQAALEQAKKDLTAAYEAAIEKAIEENNGAISKSIADAVQTALDKVETRLAVIDNAIAAIQKDIEAIRSSIASIEEQIEAINSSIEDLEGVDAALQTLIDGLTSKAADLQSQLDANAAADAEAKKALQAEIANINALIAALQAKDAELDQKIADLKAYVDGEIGSTEDWANATFATLEQYSAIQTEISTLKALIETYKTDITAAYTKAIEDAIAASEESMKEWVNELLAEGYYDIAQIDAMLAALETKLAGADSDLANQISAQQAALEQAKKDLTAAYKAAIKKAIEENNGAISKSIADAIEAALADIDSRVTDIEGELNYIKDAFYMLQNNFALRIQSFTFLPKYSDGKVKMDYTTKTTEVDVLVSPRNLVPFIIDNHLKAFVRLTDDPATRAAANEYTVAVSIVSKSDNGVLTLKVEDAQNVLPTTFWNGENDAILYILINDGNNEVISDAIPMLAHSYVSGDNDVNGFDDGDNYEGTVTE